MLELPLRGILPSLREGAQAGARAYARPCKKYVNTIEKSIGFVVWVKIAGMADNLLDHTIIAALAGAIVTLVGTILTYKIRSKKTDGDYWTQLQDAQAKFRAEIHAELEQTKKERGELKTKIDDLEKRISELSTQNEKLVLEKLAWMQKATNLQLLLQKAMQSLNLDSNKPLSEWMNEELSKIEEEIANDSEDNPES